MSGTTVQEPRGMTPAPIEVAPIEPPGGPPTATQGPPRAGIIRSQLQRASGLANRLVASRWGHTLPFWYVVEYPKSGGTWLGNILSDYLGLPFPKFSALPLAHQCLVHNHWRYNPRLTRCFYLHRDGRDVMVSFYFMRMRHVKDPLSHYDRRMAARYDAAFGTGYDPDDIRTNLPRFIELEMKRPIQCRINWPTHIDEWLDADDRRVTWLAYERLLSDPIQELAPALSTFLDEPVDSARLRESIDRWSFARLSGRKRGTEDRSSFMRKGVAGDWINHFTRDAAEVFDHFAGDQLLRLGYELDRAWIERCS